MQAILTRYLGPTNCRGARIKAECDADSIVIPYPYELSGDEVHRAAALALIVKINKRCPQSPWPTEFITGCLPSQDYCHVFTL